MEILLDSMVEGDPQVPFKYVRAVRESGGLGDVVRCLAVLQGLREKYPDARVHFFGPGYLADLVVPRAKNAFDSYIRCENQSRARDAVIDEDVFPHLNVGIEYDESHDMFCPAYLEEPATGGIVCQERTELWCRHADVPLSRPRLIPLEQDLQVAENMMNQHDRIVGIQVGATCRSREWPFENWAQLIKMLRREGIHVVIFDVCYRWGDTISHSDCEMVVNGSWFDVVGKIMSTNLMITPDSGFYHLSGALKKKTLGIFGPTSGQVISRIWNMEVPTHFYIQTDWRDVDPDILPKKNGSGKPCIPICYQRWERGWDGARYREKKEYCALIKQITPGMVFNQVMSMLNDPHGNNPGLARAFEHYDHEHGYPLSLKQKIVKWKQLNSNVKRQEQTKELEKNNKT